VTDHPLDQTIEQMAGTPQLAQAIKQGLQRLRDGVAGPDLAEMARELLGGHIDVPLIARTSAYANPILEGIDQYKRWEASLTPEERQRFINDARAAIYGDNEPPAES
jgi:hypothetical protein